MDIQEFAKEVYQNAVNHGWWETERPVDEMLDLIHCELSEAFEEYRAGRPDIWYKCIGHVCENHNIVINKCCMELDTQCKPEGIVVEIADACIRILDYLEHVGLAPTQDEVDNLMRSFVTDKPRSLAMCIAELHWNVSNTAVINYLDGFVKEVRYSRLLTALGLALEYIKERGYDPFEVMEMKHRYNITRPYKHGGKVC